MCQLHAICSEISDACGMLVQVEILSLLVRKFSVKRDEIVILTQYRAQQKTIIERLTAKRFSDKNVSTVVLSQGEC